MVKNSKYGLLINPDTKLHRHYFKEMVKLIGVYVLYRAPAENKHYTIYSEIESNYEQPILIGCIFEEHPGQQTMKKLGWDAELQENASIIHVDYDLPKLEVGALFIIPSGLDNSKGRIFRVTKLSNSMIYPASITCEIVPEYQDILSSENARDFNYMNNNFTLIQEEDEKVKHVFTN